MNPLLRPHLTAALLALLLSAATSHAQEAAPPLVEAERFDPAPAPGAAMQPGNAEMETLKKDVSEIKQDLQLLQETLDLIVNRMMADLEKENAQLRAEVRRLQEYGAPSSAIDGGFVPRPGAELFEAVAQEPHPDMAPAEPPAPPAFSWDVVEEWGRDPATAQRLGPEVSSLKGMVIVVPPGSSREEVEELARQLRSEHEAYDNINIEFFDDADAARAYADRQVTDPKHRVLSISKHKGSGRDKILYLGGGENAKDLDAPDAPADAPLAPDAAATP